MEYVFGNGNIVVGFGRREGSNEGEYQYAVTIDKVDKCRPVGEKTPKGICETVEDSTLLLFFPTREQMIAVADAIVGNKTAEEDLPKWED